MCHSKEGANIPITVRQVCLPTDTSQHREMSLLSSSVFVREEAAVTMHR